MGLTFILIFLFALVLWGIFAGGEEDRGDTNLYAILFLLLEVVIGVIVTAFSESLSFLPHVLWPLVLTALLVFPAANLLYEKYSHSSRRKALIPLVLFFLSSLAFAFTADGMKEVSALLTFRVAEQSAWPIAVNRWIFVIAASLLAVITAGIVLAFIFREIGQIITRVFRRIQARLFPKPDVATITKSQDLKGLIKALHYQKDSWVRSDAARALGESKDSRALEPLIAALRDPYSNVRQSAATALGVLGDTRAVEPLINALQNQDQSVRQVVVKALGQLGDPRATWPLVHRLNDPSESVCHEAAQVLGQLNWQPAGEWGARYYIALGQWENCASLGGAAVEILIKALSHPYMSARQGAAKVLVSIYHDAGLEPKYKQMILAQRGTITYRSSQSRHEDSSWSSDCGGHNDSQVHTDQGIGVPFNP